MICPNCGAEFINNIKFCSDCGNPMSEVAEKKESECGSLIGYSLLINDPAFAQYIKKSKMWSLAFAAVLAVVVIIGFYVLGETSIEMDNPEALYIGLGIGRMFLVSALFQTIGRSRSTTWDGVVLDKKIEQKRRKRKSANGNYWHKF